MITTKDLESLGWKHRSTAKNGGSKTFHKGEYTIWSNADNFIMKRKNSPEYEEIKISHYSQDIYNVSRKVKDIWKGVPKDIQDLKRILVETGADMEWLPEIRDEKINDILGGE
jgi:hypothetical protein